MSAHQYSPEMDFATAPRSEEAIHTLQLEGGIEMNMSPQVIHLGERVVEELVEISADWAKHYPEDGSYAREQFGVPSLIVRADFGLDPDTGELTVYEVDDHPVGSALHQSVDETARAAYDRLQDQLPYPLARAFLDDGRLYAHDDHLWLPERQSDGSVEIDGRRYGQSLVVARGRRSAPGFDEFIEPLAAHSVMTAQERDNKVSLVGMGRGILLANGDEFEAMVLDLPEQERKRFVVKGQYSSRGEDVAIFGHGKMPGVSTMAQIKRNFAHTPVVVQDLVVPPTMEDLHLGFIDRDHELYKNVPERTGQPPKAYKFQPGSEGKYHTIFRIMSVYDPESGRHVPTGGFWAARPNLVVHGASDAVFGQVTVEPIKQGASL